MTIKMHCDMQVEKNYYHVYGWFSFPARYRNVMVWIGVANRLELFLQHKNKDVERGWKIYDVFLDHTFAGFIVEAAACPDYIQERLFYYTLVFLRREFPLLSTTEVESFWSSIECKPIRRELHLVNALNMYSRRKNSGFYYVVKRFPPKDQHL